MTNPPQKQAKRVKARLTRYTHLGSYIKRYQAVLRYSDTAALVDQVATELAKAYGNEWYGQNLVLQCYGHQARAVLASLNLLPKKRGTK